MSVELISEQAKAGNGTGRRKGIRRAWLALPVAAVLVLAGCSDDKDDSKDSKSSPSASAPAAQTSAPAATTPATSGGATTPGGASAPAPGGAALTGEDKKVADNWEKLFNAATPTPERVALLENGDKMSGLVDTLAASPVAAQVSAKVKTVKISGDKADVTFDVLLAGAPVKEDAPGQAVKQDGNWKVSVTTICGLVALLQQGTAVPGCSA
ncbi:hypothetical protein [Streptomyces sp. SID3343]|uniref:hypothetical protein n=1 Tax=Streptomyces sp. SID3343 TaxID=2690260 RepID=UPI0013704303|nr:hypothetical protein [Streptomyces sp. SID3343]MYW00997.1 hypothetical protein [Streptomyces sp. SID3343]